jgi:hypothetical protein
MTFSLVASYFLPLGPKYSPKYFVAKHLTLKFIFVRNLYTCNMMFKFVKIMLTASCITKV